MYRVVSVGYEGENINSSTSSCDNMGSGIGRVVNNEHLGPQQLWQHFLGALLLLTGLEPFRQNDATVRVDGGFGIGLAFEPWPGI